MPSKQVRPPAQRVVSKVGNIGKVGDLKFSPKGVAWITFSLACSNDPRNAGRTGQSDTDWFEVRCFYDQAEHVAQCLTTGMRVIVKGTYEEEEWDGNDGKKHTTRIILARDVGPSLKWVTAEVTKTERRKPEQQEAFDDEEDPF